MDVVKNFLAIRRFRSFPIPFSFSSSEAPKENDEAMEEKKEIISFWWAHNIDFLFLDSSEGLLKQAADNDDDKNEKEKSFRKHLLSFHPHASCEKWKKASPTPLKWKSHSFSSISSRRLKCVVYVEQLNACSRVYIMWCLWIEKFAGENNYFQVRLANRVPSHPHTKFCHRTSSREEKFFYKMFVNNKKKKQDSQTHRHDQNGKGKIARNPHLILEWLKYYDYYSQWL